MPDSSHLAYAGTLALALLMFIGYLTLFALLLVLAGAARLVIYLFQYALRAFHKK